MFNVTLVNLASDARSAAPDLGRVERRGLSPAEMRALLGNFCELDPVENATVEPEIRVQVGGQSSLVRLGQRKLILYDMLNREVPGHILTLDEAMAELDGSANAARLAAQLAKALEKAKAQAPAGPPVVSSRPEPQASRPRMVAMGAAAVLLLGAIIALQLLSAAGDRPSGFTSIPAAEAAGLQGAMAGVYLTGTQAGQHGIALNASGELRLFELRAVEAPRLILARGEWGRMGGTLCLATNQPGGVIMVPNRDAWVYCGETYNRVP